jgi:hypothetical protein
MKRKRGNREGKEKKKKVGGGGGEERGDEELNGQFILCCLHSSVSNVVTNGLRDIYVINFVDCHILTSRIKIILWLYCPYL